MKGNYKTFTFTLIFLLNIVFSISSFAQKNNDTSALLVNEVDIQQLENLNYIKITGTKNFWEKKFRVLVDFGQQSPRYKNSLLRNEKGELICFNSMIAALNFFKNNGWKLVDIASIATNEGLEDMDTDYLLERVD